MPRKPSPARLVMSLVIVALILVFASTTPVEAKSVECFENGTCVTRCTQNLANGNVVEYDEGTTITVTQPDGTSHKFKCVNGEWVKQASALSPETILGVLNYRGALYGYRGDAIQKVYEDDTLLNLLSESVVKIGSAAESGPGCDPNTVGCPG